VYGHPYGVLNFTLSLTIITNFSEISDKRDARGHNTGVQTVFVVVGCDLIEQPIGAALSHELYVKGEQIDGELDNLIERRHRERVKEEGERDQQELWAASERAYFARRDEERQLELLAYHEAQAARLSATLSALITRHEAEAERYRNRLSSEAS